METRTHLNQEFEQLHDKMFRMGSLVAAALRKATLALSSDDRRLAQAVRDEDEVIDGLHNEIEDFVTRMIALEAPVATDLRELITATKVAGELERIGDHAGHIARVVGTIPAQVLNVALPRIERMTAIGTEMVQQSTAAFLEEDEAQARLVAGKDDEMDREHRALYVELITMMKDHPNWIDHGVNLLFLNRFLERLGDHVTNMCEWVIFGKSGEHVELNK